MNATTTMPFLLDPPPRPAGWVAREILLISGALVAVVVLPLAEILLGAFARPKRPVGEVARTTLLLLVLFLDVLLITYVPAFTTALPPLFSRGITPFSS